MGGHTLAMDPKEIKLSMVMAAFNGTETIVGCLEDMGSCTLSNDCGQRNIWHTVEQAVNDILEQTTIADLVKPSPLVTVESPRKVVQSA